MGRRNGKAGGETASAIQQLIGRRAESLYVLAEKVEALAEARRAITAAQEAERVARSAAVEAQEAVISAGWSLEDLRQAGLYIGAPAARRRRRSPASSPADPDASADSGPAVVEESATAHQVGPGSDDAARPEPAWVPVQAG